jgi:hypothetical protein
MGHFSSGWFWTRFLLSGWATTVWSNKRAMRAHSWSRVQSGAKTKAAALHRPEKEVRLKVLAGRGRGTAGKPLW